MSSHHIVRDDQEPALLLLTDHWRPDFVGNLLEWGPVVLVDAEGLDKVIANEFKLDVVIGTKDQLHQSKSILTYQQPIEFLEKHHYTSLDALNYLIHSKHKAVNIFTCAGQTFFDLLDPFLHQIDIVVFDDNIKWVYCKTNVFKKWYPNDQIIYVKEGVQIELGEKIKAENSFIKYKLKAEGFLEAQSATSGFWLGETV